MQNQLVELEAKLAFQEDLSLAKRHSTSFQGIIKRSGMEGLIKRLRAMNRK